MLQTSVKGGCYDDVAVLCRVRQSTSAALSDFNEAEDMLCTMRIWHHNKPVSVSQSHHNSTQTRSASTSRQGGRLPPSSAPGLMSSTIADVTPSNENSNISSTSTFRKSHSFGGTYASNGGGGPLHQRLGIQTTKREAELILTSLQNPLMVNRCYSGELGEAVQLSERFESFGSSDSRKKQQQHHRQQKRKNRYAGSKIWDTCATPDASMNGGCSTRSSGLRVRASDLNQGGKQSLSLPIGNITIPVSDIMKVDMYGEGECHKTNITTMSFGFLEFGLENRNGQEVLLAFLKASLPKDRMMIDSAIPRTKSNDTEASLDDGDFDVEKFTASRITERLESESFGEKVRRKVGRVILSIEEVVSDSLDSCGCGAGELSPPDPAFEKRDSPPRNNSLKNSSHHSISSNRSSSRRGSSSNYSTNQQPYGVELASPTPPRAYTRVSMKKIGTVNSTTSVASGDLKQQTSQRSVGTYLSVEGEDSELEPTR